MGGLPLAGIDKNRITHEGSRGSRFCFQIQVIAQYMNMYIYAYTYTCLYIFIYTHTIFSTASSTYKVQWHAPNKCDRFFHLHNKAKTTDNNRWPNKHGLGDCILTPPTRRFPSKCHRLQTTHDATV